MGAAALHSDSLVQVGSLIEAALELLAQLQAPEGTNELAGDEQAEVLVLQQLGPLGERFMHSLVIRCLSWCLFQINADSFRLACSV